MKTSLGSKDILTVGMVLISSLLTGCVSLDKGQLYNYYRNTKPPFSEQRCSLGKSSKVALTFLSKMPGASLRGDPYLAWPVQNRQEVRQVVDQAVKAGGISKYEELEIGRSEGQPWDENNFEALSVELQNQASEIGATHLLALYGTGVQESKATLLSLFNLTIIGSYIIPSRESRAYTVLNLLLFDVKSRRLCSITESSQEAFHFRPASWGSHTSAYLDARDEAFEQILTALKKMFI